MSEEYKQKPPTNNTAAAYEDAYQQILRHNEAYYPKGKDISFNNNTKALSRELKKVGGVDGNLHLELTEKLQEAKNVLQIHAVLHAFLVTRCQNSSVDVPANFITFLTDKRDLIKISFIEYLDDSTKLDEAKLGSKKTVPTDANLLETFAGAEFARFFPAEVSNIINGYTELPALQAKFLQHVVRGEQNEAEEMLKKTPESLLFKGEMTEHNGRTFKSATAFQYAVWAKDMHMLTMLKKYAPEESPLRQAIKEQLKEFNTKGLTYTYDKWKWVEDAKDTTYGGYRKEVTSTIVKDDSKGFDFKPLIDALTVYSQKLEAWEDVNFADNTPQQKACYHQWQKVVGDAQRLLPAHVAHEYCQEGRTFWEDKPHTFKGESLVRSLETDEGNWYSAKYNSGIIGERFAVDGSGKARGRWWAPGTGVWTLVADLVSHIENIKSLSATRTQELDELLSEILVTPAASQQQQCESNRSGLVM